MISSLILDSAALHPNTSIRKGKYEKDPAGPHWTVSWKDATMMTEGTHVVIHAYPEAANQYALRKVKALGLRKDSDKRNSKDDNPTNSKISKKSTTSELIKQKKCWEDDDDMAVEEVLVADLQENFKVE